MTMRTSTGSRRSVRFGPCGKRVGDSHEEGDSRCRPPIVPKILRKVSGRPPLGRRLFNFVALLPDGEVHACRKFPSPIGNVRESSLRAIYDSAEANRYRQGCGECRGCPVRSVCGGCLAVSHVRGLDVFRQRDPHCFMSERETALSGFRPFSPFD